MTRDIEEKLIIIHFNRRTNGGNQVLKDFSEKLARHRSCVVEEVFLSEDLRGAVRALFSKNLIIFSNPILLMMFCLKKKSVYFIQSIDEDLFDKYDFNVVRVFFYKIIITFLLKISRNIKIFNSTFTESHYHKLDRRLGCYSVVNNLYYTFFLENKKNRLIKNKTQCIWIGTRHKRKGFSDLIKIAKINPDHKFICIFSGGFPDLTDIPNNIEILNNVDHSEVKLLILKSQFSIITSSFESLCLPLYEGLLYKNIVFVAKSSYVEKNNISQYVNIFEKIEEVDLNNLMPVYYYEFQDPISPNNTLFNEISNEL